MPTTSPTDNHGLVRPWEHGRSFHLEALPPSPQLERVVDRHWIVRWDLRGREPFQQEVLPHPSVNLVIEPHGSWVWGVPTTRDVRLLRGEGWAVGTKFKPGAFTALTGIEASSITDGRVSLKAAFGDDDLNQYEFDAAPGARTGTPREAVGFGEVVLLSVPWPVARRRDRPGRLARRQDRHRHHQPVRPRGWENLGLRTAAEVNAARMPGARYTKAFNTLTAGFQAQAAGRTGPIASSCSCAATTRTPSASSPA